MTPGVEPARVLVVDDDPASLTLATVLLEGGGYAVMAAHDAASGLEVVKNHRVDVALIDLVLPDRSGIDLARLIRSSPGGDAIALIAVSAHFGPLAEARLSPIGFSDSLAKPIERDALLSSVSALVSPRREPSTDENGHLGRVLVVDDDPVLRRLESIRLEQRGLTVETAVDGEQALAQCAASPPDAVLTDVLMPGLDGFGLCLALRQNPATATIPIVLVSSHYVDDEDVELGRRVGATDYLVRSPGTARTADAVIAALAAPPTLVEWTDLGSATEVARAHAARVSHQLARQSRLNELLRERCAFQKTLLAASASIGESVGMTRDPVEILRAGVAPVLSAGFTTAVGFLANADGIDCAFAVGTQASGGDTVWGRPELVERAIASRESIIIPSPHSGDPDEQAWLAQHGIGTVLVLPVDTPDRAPYGVVVLAASMTDATAEVIAFARALRRTLGRALARAEDDSRFVHAQKMEAVGQLSAGIGHDFNNLLSVISCYAGFVRDAVGPDSPMLGDLGEILGAVERGAAITRQLSAFVRREEAAPRIELPDELIRGVVPMIRRLLGDERELVTNLACDGHACFIDAGQLEQVLLNLAINARDAMPDGGTITVSTSVEELSSGSPVLGAELPAGRYCVIDVADTGHGMDATTMSRVFEPFFSTKAHGNGLGLATAHAIIARARGRLSVASEVGRGTTFRIVLPWVERDEPVVATPVESAPSHGSGLVLIAEDERGLRRAIARGFERAGYRVLAAADGNEAIALAEGAPHAIDALVTDISMPGMRGTELARRLRERMPELPVVLVSGQRDAEVSAREVGGPQRFLAKPFSTDALLRCVAELLEQTSSAAGEHD